MHLWIGPKVEYVKWMWNEDKGIVKLYQNTHLNMHWHICVDKESNQKCNLWISESGAASIIEEDKAVN